MPRPPFPLASVVGLVALAGCLATPYAPGGFELGLDALAPDEIPEQLDRRPSLRPPLSAGIAWLEEGPAGYDAYATVFDPHYVHPPPLSDYQRTGILADARVALAREPFASVSLLPGVELEWEVHHEASAYDALRSAGARSQVDVAIALRTSLAEASGLNPWAIGWIGLVTVPLFPGTDLGAAAAAELCAIDVRSGILLACERGRARAERRHVFPFQTGAVLVALAEEVLGGAVLDAAARLPAATAARVARR